MRDLPRGLPRSPVRRCRFVCAAAAAAAAIVVLAVALALTVSPDLFIRFGLNQMETATGIHVRYGAGRIGLAGIVLSDVDLQVGPRTPSIDARPKLKMERLVARPSLLGLLTGRKGLPCSVVADLYEGSARLNLDEEGNALMATLEWSAIDARHVPLGPSQPEIAGLSDGRVSVSARRIDGQRTLEGSWSLAGTDMVVSGLQSGRLLLPPIELSTLITAGAWAGRRATVTELQVQGPFGRMLLSGKLVLRTPIDRTGLNMRMTLSPSTDMPQELGFLLRMMLPRGLETRARSYHVSGTLAMPVLTPLADRPLAER